MIRRLKAFSLGAIALALAACAAQMRELPESHPANANATAAAPATFMTDLAPEPLAPHAGAAPIAPAASPDPHAGHQHDAAPQAAPKAGEPYYTCPMHAEIIRDAPGDCPICEMKLVRKIAPKGGAK